MKEIVRLERHNKSGFEHVCKLRSTFIGEVLMKDLHNVFNTQLKPENNIVFEIN